MAEDKEVRIDIFAAHDSRAACSTGEDVSSRGKARRILALPIILYHIIIL